MNYATQTEQLHTFTDAPRVTINRWHITGHSNWDSTEKTTVQVAAEHDAIPSAIVDFIAALHNTSYHSKEDIELLQRFAGAMGLDYPHAPGIKA
ncbi:hypothetical protein [uncultured phage MedDCM-OCT-S04-C148]|nr:hypothetical protein [uncultured phage MedDCM-OCT-S04-C148]